MTPERKKYLKSISNEERAIRYQLKIHNACICNCKYDLNFNKHCIIPYSVLTETIRDEKNIIKALKKQLPAPRKRKTFWVGGERGHLLTCPKCENYVKPFSDNYCATCGQKLR